MANDKKPGRAVKCELPADIGHGSGKSGEYDSHVNDYIDSFIAYKVQPLRRTLHGAKKRKALYQELV